MSTSSPDADSPITAELVVAGAVSISEVVADAQDVYWAENRPDEAGRVVIVRWRDGAITDVTGPAVNIRTRVHEYGGGAWWVADGRVFYSDDAAGGELFVVDVASGETRQLTQSGHRYADGRTTPDGRWYVAVRERHEPERVVNEIVRIAIDGSGEEQTLHEGHDFYASPRISSDGRSMVCVAWDHPDMPWDETALLCGLLDDEGWDAHVVPGVSNESIVLPDWTADGRLVAVTDRDNWWNLYEIDPNSGERAALITGEVELATPGWVFGLSTYAETRAGLAAIVAESGGDLLEFPDGTTERRHTSITSLRSLGDGRVAYAASSYREESAVWIHDGIEATRISHPRELGLSDAWFPPPEPVTFAVDGAVAHGLFYEPAHPDVEAPSSLPPLIVLVHGGPTAAARRTLSLSIRYWTSRGIAVVDVDYRGSTRYGREYRQSLRGGWGALDVDDCVAAANHLAASGRVDPDRMVISGGSAGGLTVLNALAHHDVFAGGIGRYAVADLASLAADTHKFESKYLDRLVGVLPDDAAVYAARSPVNHVYGIRAPLLIFQGLDDKVVPPSQAESMVAALEANGVSVDYVTFPGEGHGFRAAETMIAVLRAESAFVSSL